MSRTARDAVRAGVTALTAISDTAQLDAELLMAHALGVSRSQYLLKAVELAEPANYWPMVERRKTHEPIAYIIGVQPFWSIDIKVAPGVLIPRSDSETLIEAAIKHFAGKVPPNRILDLGSGPGTLLLAALTEFPDAEGVGVERSAVARAIAEENSDVLELSSRAAWQEGDWTTEDWPKRLDGPFDLVLCNPPYIEADEHLDPDVADYEPHEALFAGRDGLDDYRHIIPALSKLLSEQGLAIMEIGWNQAESVSKLAEESSFSVTLHKDLAGRDRALSLKK